MKKLLHLLWVGVLQFIVVGATSATNPLPDSLGIGENFPPSNLWFDCALFTNSFSGNGFERAYGNSGRYDSSKGSLEMAAEDGLAYLGRTFKPAPGTENHEYQIILSFEAELQKGNYQTVARQDIFSAKGSFKLQKDVDGNFKIPAELLEMSLEYRGYLPYYVPGLTGVKLVVRESGREILREESQNGVSDTTCSLYPGQPNYSSPDILRLYSTYVVPAIRSVDIKGELTLQVGAFWKTYDLNGKQLASSEDPVPPKLRVTLVMLKTEGLKSLQASSLSGMKLEITASVGASITIEYTDVIGGEWEVLTTLTNNPTGITEFVDGVKTGQRFYRARIEE